MIQQKVTKYQRAFNVFEQWKTEQIVLGEMPVIINTGDDVPMFFDEWPDECSALWYCKFFNEHTRFELPQTTLSIERIETVIIHSFKLLDEHLKAANNGSQDA